MGGVGRKLNIQNDGFPPSERDDCTVPKSPLGELVLPLNKYVSKDFCGSWGVSAGLPIGPLCLGQWASGPVGSPPSILQTPVGHCCAKYRPAQQAGRVLDR